MKEFLRRNKFTIGIYAIVLAMYFMGVLVGISL